MTRLARFALAACLTAGPACAAETPVRGGTAVFSLSQDPTMLTPSLSSNVPDRQIGCIIYQGLIEVSPDYRILPLLARAWTIAADGLTYSFDLVHAQWHDGQDFTSEDVKYSLLDVSAKYSSIFANAGKRIASIDTPAPDKVVIHLKETFGPFLTSLGCIQGGAILPAHLYRGTNVLTNSTTTTTPVGTGGFKLAEWKRGDYLRLTRNDAYYEPGLPYLDEVIGKVIPQATSRIQALQAGEVDMVQPPPLTDLPAVRADPKLKVVTSDNAPLSAIAFFNVTRKPLDDKRVRHALFMATDRDYLFKNAFFSIGHVGTMPITADIGWAANPDIDYRRMYPFDPRRADALLDEAGYPRRSDGQRFTLHIAIFATQYPEFQQVALALKSMWRTIGVDVVIDALEDTTYLQRVDVDRDTDVSLVNYTSYSDPALGVSRTFVTNAIGKPYGNASGYSNPEVDRLFEAGERATDLAERGRLYRQVQAILAEDLPVMQLRDYRDNAAAAKDLKGLWGVAQGNGHWVSAWLSP